MSEDYGFVVGFGTEGVSEGVNVAGFAQGEFELGDVGVDGFGDLGEADAEESDDDCEDFVARGYGVEDAGLHCSGTRGCDEVDIVFGHEDGSEVVAHALEHVGVFGAAMVDHLTCGGLEGLFGQGDGAGDTEVWLGELSGVLGHFCSRGVDVGFEFGGWFNFRLGLV